jgi:hypothetical protein
MRSGPSAHSMIVRQVTWSDFDGWTQVYYSRFDEVATNPELGVFTRTQRPSWGEEAVWWGKFYKGIQDGDTVAVVAEDGGRVVGIAEVSRKGSQVEDCTSESWASLSFRRRGARA